MIRTLLMATTSLSLLLSLLGPAEVLVPAKVFGQAQETMSLDQLRQQRGELAHRPRRMIMNNDGCDVLYFPQQEPATVANFLAKRTTPLAGTHVDTIAFCPTSSGFSYFTHRTAAGTILTRSGPEFGIQPGTRNLAQELLDQGTDCLQAVVEFGHAHEMEVFWSMRMNDTHDVAHRPDKPYFLFPPLKTEHPEWLVGNPEQRTPFGRWSSVDYARPEIRELAFAYLEEVCRGYAVDGVELDFFRHLCYFKNTATGGTATDAQREKLTALMRQVREMTEQQGMRRGRPILVAIRVPDSIGFCRDLGLDVERWLSEGLVDLLITTGYFRLNPWEYSVELGHRYGVSVYPCLSDSRVRGESRFRRASVASYRGRAMNAWAAGADGLHLFNHFDPHASIWRELGDPDALAKQDKLYFITVRDGDPRSYLAKGREHRTTKLFGPSHPQRISPTEPWRTEISIGDDFSAISRDPDRPKVALHLEMAGAVEPERIQVRFNGQRLESGTVNGDWLDYPLPLDAITRGANRVEVSAGGVRCAPATWSAKYSGEGLPKRPWYRDPGSTRTHAQLNEGSLLLADRGEQSGDYLYYRSPWGADPDGEAVVEARVKVHSGSSFLIVSNGIGGERLGLWPDRIELFHQKQLHYAMDTTDDFHQYRIECQQRDLRVYVDGELRIQATGALGPRSGYTRNEVSFGAANSPMMGEAEWAMVRARAEGVICRDLVVSVSY